MRRLPLPGTERGFSVIELALVVAMLAVAAALVVSFGPFARSSEGGKSAAQRIADAELERLRNLGWAKLLMTSPPATSGDPRSPLSGVRHDPFSGVTRASGSTYAAPGAKPEALAIAGHPNADPDYIDPRPGEWEDGQVVGKVYRFVTFAGDDRTQKRVTIAVTAAGEKTVMATSIVADPNAGARTSSADETLGALPEGPVLRTLFPYDAPAERGAYRPPDGDHQAHDTLATPDLLGPDAPANPFDPPQAPPYFNYSTDVSGGVAGGRVIQRARRGCRGEGPEQVQQWASAPLEESLALTGGASASLFTQTAGGVTGSGKLCLEIYDVQLDDGRIEGRPQLLGSATNEIADWPAEPEPVSFQFRFAEEGFLVEEGHSLAVRVTVHASSATDLALLYDHPYYASSFQFETPEEPELED